MAQIEQLRQQAEQLIAGGLRFKSSDEDIYLAEIMPSGTMPKYITKQHLQELKNIADTRFEGYARYVDYSTGEVLEGREALKIYDQHIERADRATKPKLRQHFKSNYQQEVNIVIKNATDEIDRIENVYVREYLERLISDSITVAGRQVTAETLQNLAGRGFTLMAVIFASNQYRAGMEYVYHFYTAYYDQMGTNLYPDEGTEELEADVQRAFEGDILIGAYLDDEDKLSD